MAAAPTDQDPAASADGAAQAASPAAEPPPTWRWLLVFCLARALFSTTQTTYSAALPLLKEDWAMSAEQSGMISSAFYVGFLVSLFSVGFMTDRWGAKRTYLITSVGSAITAMLFGLFADGFLSALLLFGLTGLLAGGSYTPGLGILAQRFPQVGRGRAIGFYIAASSAGYALSLYLSSGMISLSGWRAAFIVTCLGPTGGMVIGWLALRGVANVVAPHQRAPGEQSMWQAVVRSRPVMLILLAYTFHSWEVLGLWAWTSYYLAQVYGGGAAGEAATSIAAIFSGTAFLVSMGGPILGGSLSDRLGRTAVIMLFSSVSAVCAYTLGWIMAAPFALVVGVSFLFQVASIGDSPVLSTALTELVPQRHLGAAYSLRSVMGFGAGSVSPWLFGRVLDWGHATPGMEDWLIYGVAFATLGVGGMFTPLCVLLLRRQPASRLMAGGMR